MGRRYTGRSGLILVLIVSAVIVVTFFGNAMKQLILTDAVIQSLVTRPDVLREFPHLKNLTNGRQRNRTSCCGRRSPGAINSSKMAKLSLIGMPSDRLKRLKQLLRVDELVVYNPSSKGPSRTVV